MSKPRILCVPRGGGEGVAAEAAQALAAGELVILPTDTVYGLAARADDEEAVRRLLAAKRRPPGRPLPVLLAGAWQLAKVASEVSASVRALAAAFWPGPLTIVVPKAQTVLDLVTARQPTVGVRVPDEPIAQAVLGMVPFAVAVTSANLSDEPTPATARECAKAFGELVAVALEAGPRTGRPSTVVAVEGGKLRVLRAGPITEAQLRAVLAAEGESAGDAAGLCRHRSQRD
jgi:L-threonylcarbamoyladenylate synthase